MKENIIINETTPPHSTQSGSSEQIQTGSSEQIQTGSSEQIQTESPQPLRSSPSKSTKGMTKTAMEPIPPIRRASNKVQWYALYTAPRAEKKVAERFTESGIEHYLPIQKVMRKWSDRMKEVEVPVVNGYIFVYVSELQFKSVLNTYGAIQFVREFGKPVPIPDKQLARLRFMVDNAEGPVDFSIEELTPGIPISIIRGPLQGLIGELKEVKGKHHVVIRIDKFGCALTTVQLSFVTLLKRPATGRSQIAGTGRSQIAATGKSQKAGTEHSKKAGTEHSKKAGTEHSKIAGTKQPQITTKQPPKEPQDKKK